MADFNLTLWLALPVLLEFTGSLEQIAAAPPIPVIKTRQGFGFDKALDGASA